MRVLLIFSHPDDEVLACGGTVARLSEEGFEVYTLILGEGITSRDKKGIQN
ncbi:PIG-L deacetylase family protein [Pampinifervens florentissimum]|uniref:PIG-L deacetylase family protein n=1 Tax=Pampinifervens florentissimum TaxID=1632019 RepID=UPI001C2CF830|nr:PIG-L family deacetylase [Hydrogenobacter sp. T-8]